MCYSAHVIPWWLILFLTLDSFSGQGQWTSKKHPSSVSSSSCYQLRCTWFYAKILRRIISFHLFLSKGLQRVGHDLAHTCVVWGSPLSLASVFWKHVSIIFQAHSYTKRCSRLLYFFFPSTGSSPFSESLVSCCGYWYIGAKIWELGLLHGRQFLFHNCFTILCWFLLYNEVS